VGSLWSAVVGGDPEEGIGGEGGVGPGGVAVGWKAGVWGYGGQRRSRGSAVMGMGLMRFRFVPCFSGCCLPRLALGGYFECTKGESFQGTQD
jgi:hypothetical protein